METIPDTVNDSRNYLMKYNRNLAARYTGLIEAEILSELQIISLLDLRLIP